MATASQVACVHEKMLLWSGPASVSILSSAMIWQETQKSPHRLRWIRLCWALYILALACFVFSNSFYPYEKTVLAPSMIDAVKDQQVRKREENMINFVAIWNTLFAVILIFGILTAPYYMSMIPIALGWAGLGVGAGFSGKSLNQFSSHRLAWTIPSSVIIILGHLLVGLHTHHKYNTGVGWCILTTGLFLFGFGSAYVAPRETQNTTVSNVKNEE